MKILRKLMTGSPLDIMLNYIHFQIINKHRESHPKIIFLLHSAFDIHDDVLIAHEVSLIFVKKEKKKLVI